MVAIFAGAGAGLERSSANILGGAGQLGTAGMGRGGESVAVNAATGNLVISRQDEFLVGQGPDAAIGRTYNSLIDPSGGDRDNNDKWQQSTTRRVFGLTGSLNAAGSTIKRLGSDGAVVTFKWGTKNGLAAYWSTSGDDTYDRLSRDGASADWKWTDGASKDTEFYRAIDGFTNSNAAEFRIRERADVDGNKLTFDYLDGSDKLEKVATRNGEWLKYTWSGNNITKIETGYTDGTAKTLTRTWYEYTSGRLTRVLTDLSPEDNVLPSLAQSYWTAYTYDGSGRVTQILQKDGSQIDIAYNAAGQVQSYTVTVANGVTRVTTIAYATLGNGDKQATITAPDGTVTVIVSTVTGADGDFSFKSVTAPPVGGTSQAVQFTYEADGDLQSVTDAAGKVTNYSYDARGNVVLITDATSKTINRYYDANDRLIRETTTGVDADSSGVQHPHALRLRYAGPSEVHD